MFQCKYVLKVFSKNSDEHSRFLPIKYFKLNDVHCFLDITLLHTYEFTINIIIIFVCNRKLKKNLIHFVVIVSSLHWPGTEPTVFGRCACKHIILTSI